MNAFRLHALKLPLRRPHVTAVGSLRERAGWVVELVDADGLHGFGEATPLTEFTGETVEATRAALETHGPVTAETGTLPIELDATPAARFALETALADLASQRARLPLSRWLEGTRSSIAVSALLDGSGIPALESSAGAAAAAGFRTAKLKVGGRPLEEDLERMRVVRRTAPGMRLRIDANGAWSEIEAFEGLRAATALEVELCEQPVPASSLKTLRRLRELDACKVAADETLAIPAAADRVIAERAAHVLVLKLAVVGGLKRALELARVAQSAGIASYVTSGIDGEIARAAAAHLAAALPSQAYAHGLATGDLIDAPVRNAWLTPRAGAIQLPERPGLGLEVTP